MMAKRKRKSRKRPQSTPAPITLEHGDVKELQRVTRKLLLLQQRRRAADRKVAQLTDLIRDTRNFLHSITAPKGVNVGALPGETITELR